MSGLKAALEGMTLSLIWLSVAIWTVACCDKDENILVGPCPEVGETVTETEKIRIPKKELPKSDPPSPSGSTESAHPWEGIVWVPAKNLLGPGSILNLSARPTSQGLSLTAYADDCTPELFEKAAVRMHLPGERVVKPDTHDLGLTFTHGRGEPPQVWGGTFAWPRKPTFDEAVVEMDLGDNGRFWIEVPYGFFSPPSKDLIPVDSRRGSVFPEVMKDLGEKDHVVPFRHVTYGTFDLPGGEKMTVHASNPFDAHVELELYREPGGVGESSYRWKLHEPRTFATIVPGNQGRVLKGRQMMERLHEDGLRRSDHYTFNRGDDPTRSWGTLQVGMGDHKIEIPIPSILYGYTHGSADTHHERRVVFPNQVLENWLF